MRKVRNKVCKKLEAGNGNIAGMKMLLPWPGYKAATVLFEVTVRGFSFETYDRGVSISVTPLHGAGHLTVSVTDLIDDTEAARALYFRRADAAEFVRLNKPKTQSDRQWVSCVVSLRAGLTEAQRKAFDARAEVILGKGKELKKASAWELEKLLPELAGIKFDLGESAEDED